MSERQVETHGGKGDCRDYGDQWKCSVDSISRDDLNASYIIELVDSIIRDDALLLIALLLS